MQTPIENLIPQTVINQLIVLEGELICMEAVSYADEVRFGWQYKQNAEWFDVDRPCAHCGNEHSIVDECDELLAFNAELLAEAKLAQQSMTYDDLPF